jgi:threonine efflux protein
MSYISTFILIGGLYLIAAASPGPNIFIISQLPLAGERQRACLVAAGITAGSTVSERSRKRVFAWSARAHIWC